MKYCPKCNSQLNDNQKRCLNCDTPIITLRAQTDEYHWKLMNPPYIKFIFVASLIYLICFIYNLISFIFYIPFASQIRLDSQDKFLSTLIFIFFLLMLSILIIFFIVLKVLLLSKNKIDISNLNDSYNKSNTLVHYTFVYLIGVCVILILNIIIIAYIVNYLNSLRIYNSYRATMTLVYLGIIIRFHFIGLAIPMYIKAKNIVVLLKM